MMMKCLLSNSKLTLLVATMLLAGCQGLYAPGPGCPTPEATADEGEKILLEKPITLNLGVLPMRVVDTSRPPTRATGELSRSYSEEDMKNSTLNTPDPTYHITPHVNDWIRTIDIPELTLGVDYKVSQERPMFRQIEIPYRYDPEHRIDDDYRFAPFPSGKLYLPIVTIYKLPKDGNLSFFINAWTELMQPGTSFIDPLRSDQTDRLRKVRKLDLQHPYMTAYPSRFPLRIDDETVANYNPDAENVRPPYYSLMTASYLPMYGRITEARVYKGVLYGKQLGRESEEIETVYVERATAEVEIRLQTRDELFPDKVYPDQYYILSNGTPGRYVNMLSIIPDNWEGVQQARAKWSKEANPQSHIPYLGDRLRDGWDAYNVHIFKQGLQHPIFMPENFPTKPEEQSTIRVGISKSFRTADNDFSEFDPNDHGNPRKDYRNFKQFDVLFGEKNPQTGLYEVHRNTLYRIYVRMKRYHHSSDPQIEVIGWTDQDLPKEF